MKGYSADHVFTRADLIVWRAAIQVVESIIDPAEYMEADPLRCHEVARFVAQVLGTWLFPMCAPDAQVSDGHFGGVEHSWIELRHGYILDVYVVGRLPMVQLVYTGILLCRDKYRPDTPRMDILQPIIDQLMAAWRARTHKICEMVNDRCWICGDDE